MKEEMKVLDAEEMEMVTGGHRPLFNDGVPCSYRISATKATDRRDQLSEMAVGSEYDPSGLRIPPVGPQPW